MGDILFLEAEEDRVQPQVRQRDGAALRIVFKT
jgi:hypothetical protein